MADTLKGFFDRSLVKRIGAMLSAAEPTFDERAFVRDAAAGLAELELMDRGRHIAAAMHRALPQDVPRALDVIIRSLGPVYDDYEGGHGLAPFLYLPHTVFVADHGLAAFDEAMRAQHELTRRFSAEFSIRVFLDAEPERTLAVLRKWASDPDPHVRRLVSEGTRPRLPWASRLRAFQNDPRPVLALLELLKDDPSEYVRRSVANNLNDIGKDHPKLLIDTCRRWMRGASEERRRLVAHALRVAVKRGDAAALAVLGYGARPTALEVRGTVAPKRVPIGGRASITVEIANGGKKPARAVIDLAVHYVKASGATNAKVFKGRAVELASGARESFTRTVRFHDMTTRKHHAGKHAVDVLVNGEATRIGMIDLTRAATPPRQSR